MARQLFPLNRSMTGEGLRTTLAVLAQWLPVQVTEVPSGTNVFDWVVPEEWNVVEAWIKGPDGGKIVDFDVSNLHIVTNSSPVHTTLSLAELETHLHSLPEQPETVPYRRGNQDGTWGFCLSESVRSGLVDGDYEAYIDASITSGSLTYGEVFIPGTTDDEIMISAHICHPSLANDNVSGIVVAASLARRALESDRRRLGLRFIFAPATIGSIAWLHGNRETSELMHAGLTLACLGDGAALTYKKSFGGSNRIDRVASRVVESPGNEGSTIDFFPFGYDERQYNSPGFRLPVGSLMRSQHGTFPEYHTSDDDLSFISEPQLQGALVAVETIISQLQSDPMFRNLSPFGEPQLGKRGLYTSVQNAAQPEQVQYALLWMLAYSDGVHGIAEISNESGIDADTLLEAATILVGNGLLEPVE
ncbi:MAG: DUF4910 domain-containing protein [Actinomycetia bacterium]|nr:DUF4910 domain-containing protein [Actinomycetes bacterium]